MRNYIFKEELTKIKNEYKCDDVKNKTAELKQLLLGKPLVLYGAGEVGVCIAKTLRYYDINATCFCDKNKSGTQAETTLPIISPQILIENYSDSNIIICSFNCAEEIKQDLLLLGVNPAQIYSKDLFRLRMLEFDEIEAHLEGYERTYKLLVDDKSKQVMLERIKCYLSGDAMNFDSGNLRYFDPKLIQLSHEEVFVDGGMYTGDTANIFFEFTNNKYAHYYGFEPDTKNFIQASYTLIDKANITITEKGLFSCEKQIGFDGSAAACKINEINGYRFINVTSLDAFFLDKPHIPTLIKMDIEGAEAEALHGAKNIISKHKPRLAICVYHKLDDIYVLPEIIKSFREDYTFYLRHYSDYLYETVLYAI